MLFSRQKNPSVDIRVRAFSGSRNYHYLPANHHPPGGHFSHHAFLSNGVAVCSINVKENAFQNRQQHWPCTNGERTGAKAQEVYF